MYGYDEATINYKTRLNLLFVSFYQKYKIKQEYTLWGLPRLHTFASCPFCPISMVEGYNNWVDNKCYRVLDITKTIISWIQYTSDNCLCGNFNGLPNENWEIKEAKPKSKATYHYANATQ